MTLGTRRDEHKKDSEKLAEKKFTRQTRKESITEENKSAITDHIAAENHVIDWKEPKILERESNEMSRKIREAIWIRRRGEQVMNRDIGSYTLDHVYDPLIRRTLHSRDEKKSNSRERSSGSIINPSFLRKPSSKMAKV